MAVLRCKMCGGELIIEEGVSVAVCDYCGTKQTVPKTNSDVITNLFNRANNLRLKCEFDKAASVYEKIVQEDDSEAEAHWGLVLCKYGIEYVTDPSTGEKVPTCHRTLYEPITKDVDYQATIDYSDSLQQSLYEREARKIDKIQKDILAIVKEEKPFDVFLCYKETDESGKRTQDSVIANDIYYQLTQEGYKVFYAAITLEDKLGQEYEPYIFAALNSAKVMLVIGTTQEYFNAVWVKNEWSRFMNFMKSDRKKLLIPCYKDMDAYDLPEEFSHLQAQDMSKIGFINDVVRGIKKVISKETEQTNIKETVVVQQSAGGTNAQAQIKRGNMALGDLDWEKANGFFEEALNLDPENAEAYLGKILARDRKPSFESWVEMQKAKYVNAETENLQAGAADEAHIKEIVQKQLLPGYLKEEEIRKLYEFDFTYKSSYSNRKNQKARQLGELSKDRVLAHAMEYASGKLQEKMGKGLSAIEEVLNQRITQAEKEDGENKSRINKAYAELLYRSDLKAEELGENARCRKENDYQSAVVAMDSAKTAYSFEHAINSFKALDGYKDCNERIENCRKALEEINEKQRKKEAQERGRKKKNTIIAVVAVMMCIAAILLVTLVVIPTRKYNKADSYLKSGDYQSAMDSFDEIDGFKDSHSKSTEAFIALKNTYKETADRLLKDGDNINAAVNYIKAGEPVLAKYAYDFSTKIAATEAASAGVTSSNTLLFATDREKLKDPSFSDISSISNFDERRGITGLDSSGKVITQSQTYMFGDDAMEEKVKSWENIDQLEYDLDHTFALLNNGSVVEAYHDPKDSIDSSVFEWENIVEIGTYRYGLSLFDLWGIDSDGKFYYATAARNKGDSRFDLRDFTSIKKVQFENGWMFGLTTDGKLVTSQDKEATTKYSLPAEINTISQKVSDVVASEKWIFVLQEDGTVISGRIGYAGDDDDYSAYISSVQTGISNWKKIVYLQAVSDGIIGEDIYGNIYYQSLEYTLQSESGTVRVYTEFEHPDIKITLEGWKDIVYVSSNLWEYESNESRNVLGVHADGTVSSLGTGKYLTLEKKEKSSYYGNDYYAESHYDGTYDKVDSWKLW